MRALDIARPLAVGRCFEASQSYPESNSRVVVPSGSPCSLPGARLLFGRRQVGGPRIATGVVGVIVGTRVGAVDLRERPSLECFQEVVVAQQVQVVESGRSAPSAVV